MQTQKKPRAGVVVRPFFVAGVPTRPGDYYDGPEAGYLIAVGKMRPLDSATETVVSDADGNKVVEPRKSPAIQPAAPQTDMPDETWTNAEIRSWIEMHDPGVKLNANTSKVQLLQLAQDLARQIAR